MLIAALASIPIFGQGMTFFDFIFMKQKLHLDFQNIVNVMERQRIYGKDVPLWFFLFPEGTLNTPNNRESSHAYAEKSGIKDKPSYVILPKATGLFMCADALSDQVDYIVNLTVGYSGLEREDVPYDNYLMENVFLKQHYPKQVHIHVEKVLLKSIPGFIPDSTTEVTDYVPDQKFLKAVADPNLDKRKFQFNSWIQQVFREKDAKMKEFYDNQKFLGDAVHWNIKCEAQDILLIAILWGSAFYTVPIFWQVITTLFTSLRWAIGI
ncbi:hypothetical protein HK103_001699 [Boothiomyces macroporosus]|uniref:Phospholipid/glycerol acyltransferase domain-containing protein n=1 Tax=Boothiomyces macroporosus TaxID=261099 RepID=A0AAD5UM91_9FUNG|nr:hypothetical protein HK103_001699 [Boothiomyces macroporosus]